MSYTISVEFKGDHILARHTGEDNYRISLELWSKIVDTCTRRNCYYVLGITETTTPLNTMDAFNHGEIFKTLGVTSKYRIAWTERNPAALQSLRFVETVLRNRGITNGRLFSDASEALYWLLAEEAVPGENTP